MEDSQEKDYSFLGNDTFPNLYDALVYERKLRVNIWRDKFTSDHFRVNHLLKLSTLSEPSIVKFIENQSEHLQS